jgi:hypothetical protein
VRETRYIDRHFMDEYALFYSRMLNPPKNTVTRLHFFEKAFDRSALTRWMRDAMRGRDPSKMITKEAGRYHGFCSVRPIPESPIATAMQPMIEKVVGRDAFDLRVDLRFVRSGEYLPSLARRVSPANGADLASRIAMSRWCAIVRWFIRDQPIVEFVYDTTDILRGSGDNLLLAIVVLSSRLRRTFYRIAERRGVPRA